MMSIRTIFEIRFCMGEYFREISEEYPGRVSVPRLMHRLDANRENVILVFEDLATSSTTRSP